MNWPPESVLPKLKSNQTNIATWVSELLVAEIFSLLIRLCLFPKMVGGYNTSLIVLSLCLRLHVSNSFAPSRVSRVAGRTTISTTTRWFFNFGDNGEEGKAEAGEEEEQDTGYVDEDDLIEKIFGVFFGKKEAKPSECPWWRFYIELNNNSNTPLETSSGNGAIRTRGR